MITNVVDWEKLLGKLFLKEQEEREKQIETRTHLVEHDGTTLMWDLNLLTCD